MEEATKKMAEGLLKAIKAENDGYYFYKMAAQNIGDAKGKEVFEMLAGEEQDHSRFLKAQYKSVLETGRPDTSVQLGSKTDLSGPSPIFSEDIRKNLDQADQEMSALSIGIQLEMSSISYYKEQAKAASQEDIRKLYNELADWELGHYYALLRQEEALKEEYWAQMGFEPF